MEACKGLQSNRYLATGPSISVVFDLPPRYVPEVVTSPGGQAQIPLIGVGSFGAVIKCWDSVANEKVAIKKMLNPFQNELFARRAYREFHLMRHLPWHRNVMELRNAFTFAASSDEFSEYYIVMELMDADLLRFWRGVPAGKIISHKELSYLFYQILCAINHLHCLGIVHRDLKPNNLAIKQQGCEVRLLDFGLARCLAVKMSTYVYARWYRSPEVILGIEYSTKADIWALGCIFAELLMGKTYLKGQNHIDQWLQISERFGLPGEGFMTKVEPHICKMLRERTPKERCREVPFTEQFPDELFPPDDDEYPEVFCAAQARDLLSKLLVLDPDFRLSARGALSHPYVSVWYSDSDVLQMAERLDCNLEPEEVSSDFWKHQLWQELSSYMEEQAQNNTSVLMQ